MCFVGDYYPFGMPMPGRQFNSGNYRFGFNGMEKDDEVIGNSGTSYTAEYWQYDPRLGRRWNVDPVTYPWQSSYAAFNNNPIYFVDPLGLEACEPDDCSSGGGSSGGSGGMTDEQNRIARGSANPYDVDDDKDPPGGGGNSPQKEPTVFLGTFNEVVVYGNKPSFSGGLFDGWGAAVNNLAKRMQGDPKNSEVPATHGNMGGFRNTGVVELGTQNDNNFQRPSSDQLAVYSGATLAGGIGPLSGLESFYENSKTIFETYEKIMSVYDYKNSRDPYVKIPYRPAISNPTASGIHQQTQAVQTEGMKTHLGLRPDGYWVANINDLYLQYHRGDSIMWIVIKRDSILLKPDPRGPGFVAIDTIQKR